ncbi:hypothetical protein BBO99_00006245 [Phytophthora kernoviae]|uniref:Transmembrane protein 198 n=2 Tax=Phytophthora kernoviae TaxID=325452 RepID=A0A3R7GTN0_9STRA|nr:hypothetical protein G195_007461 [Phytophthora kernoviae 00238/432]KAG2521989.1 hypothetical protein JM16_006046 [Phytophthora kernoviae]KAG2523595.1 hypothetical protein JM18_005714 [Phytophthora kernoviae]RLN38356.1 hypothetical protein BBI17_006349 [Phytophthora kernoviae]RLN78056.1 hypothetical protein BBO99_00006245 [Phytophthora kernoviae]
MELTHVYEELEKQNLQIDKYKKQIKSHKRELEQLRTQRAKSIGNDSKVSTSRGVVLEQQKRAAQMMIGTPSTGASLGQKREELDRKLKDAERERKKYELAAKRIETALVELQVFQNDRMENMLPGAKTSKPGQDAASSDDLERVLNEQRAYIRVLEEAVHLKATDFEITGHEELLVVLAELRHTIYEQEKDVDEKSHALTAIQDQLEQEQQNHAVTKELMSTLQRKQEDNTQRLREQESELYTQIDKMRSQLQQQEEQIHQFRGVSSDAQRKEETLQSRLDAFAKTQNLTEAKLEDATRSARALKEQLKAVSTQCEEAKHQTTSLKEECAKKQSHLDEMNALQEEMLGSVDEYAGKMKRAHEKVERLEEELQACHKSDAHARKQTEDAERSAEEQIRALRTKIEATEHREQQVQVQSTALQQEKNQLESTLAEVQQNLEEQIQVSNTQQQVITARESKCCQVEEMVAELEAALGTALRMMVEKPVDSFQQNESNRQLNAKILQVGNSQREQIDKVKMLQVQNSTFASYFMRMVQQSPNSGSGSFSGSEGSDDSSGSLEGVTALLSSAEHIKVGPALLAVLAAVGGAVVCFAGYRLFRPTVFCCAFLVGGLFVAGIVETAFASMSWMPTASWIAFGIGGLAAGVLVLMLYSASIFLAGAAGGVMLAFSLNTSFGAKIYPDNPDVILVVMAVVLGIVGGLLALKLEKPVLIATTSIVGATICVWGIGYFAGDYPNGADLKQFRSQNDKGEWVYNIPDAWWAYLAGMGVMFLLGMSVQIKKTARGYDHGGKTESHAIGKSSGHAAV